MTTEHFRIEPLENELVRLIPLNAGDFEALFAVAADPLIWEQHPNFDRYKPEVFKLYFDSAVSEQSAFLIIEKQTGNIIGCTRYYDWKPSESSVIIGYTFLARAFWGGKYNQSVKQLMFDYAFEYVDTIFLHVASTNLRSITGTTRLGAKKMGEYPYDENGKEVNYIVFAIEKSSFYSK